MLEAGVLALLLLSSAAPAPDRLYEREIATAIEDVKDVHPVPAALVKAVITQESSWDPRAVSRAGALGLMQVLPGTAAKVGVSREELFDPAKNILAGVRLLAFCCAITRAMSSARSSRTTLARANCSRRSRTTVKRRRT